MLCILKYICLRRVVSKKKPREVHRSVLWGQSRRGNCRWYNYFVPYFDRCWFVMRAFFVTWSSSAWVRAHTHSTQLFYDECFYCTNNASALPETSFLVHFLKVLKTLYTGVIGFIDLSRQSGNEHNQFEPTFWGFEGLQPIFY